MLLMRMKVQPTTAEPPSTQGRKRAETIPAVTTVSVALIQRQYTMSQDSAVGRHLNK